MTDPLSASGVALAADHLIGLRRLALDQGDAPPLAVLPGGFVTRKRGHGQEMADVREYVAGDDIRHLDRGSTARTGVLHVRSFQEERDRVTILVADFRPSMLWGLQRAFRSVAAAEALALIGWRVIEEGGRVGLLALGAGDPVAVAARGRVRGMLGVIGGMVRAHDAALQLALSGLLDDPALDEGLRRLSRIAPVGAELVIVSGFDAPGDALADRLRELDQKRTLRLFAMRDGLASKLPPGIYPIRLQDGTRRKLRVTGAETAALPAEAEAWSGFPTLPLDAASPIEETAATLNAAFPAGRVAIKRGTGSSRGGNG